MGPLQAGESYWLNVTVTQADGATLTPSNYLFEGLAANGHADAPLRVLANQEAAHAIKATAPTKPGKRKHKRSRP